MVAKDDTEIKDAYNYLQEISADEKKRMVYEAREKWLMDQRTREKLARIEGMQEGKLEGRREGIIEGLMKAAEGMLVSGLTIKQVEDITGLKVGEIIKIQKK